MLLDLRQLRGFVGDGVGTKMLDVLIEDVKNGLAEAKVNENDVIAGNYYDSTYTTWTGFTEVNGAFQPIIDPLTPTQTAVTGISNGNVLVGNADDSGSGFAATGCVP